MVISYMHCWYIISYILYNVHNCYCLVSQLCQTLWDPIVFSTPGFSVLHHLPEFLKFMSIESVMPSNHLICCHPLLLPPSIFPSIRVFSDESVLHIRWPKYCISASTSVLSMNIQDWFPLGWTSWIPLQSMGLSRVFSNTAVQKHQFFSTQPFYGPTLTSIHDRWINHNFD